MAALNPDQFDHAEGIVSAVSSASSLSAAATVAALMGDKTTANTLKGKAAAADEDVDDRIAAAKAAGHSIADIAKSL